LAAGGKNKKDKSTVAYFARTFFFKRSRITMFIDTHVHLTDPRYGEVGGIIDGFKADGIDFVINVSYDEATIGASRRLSDAHKSVYCTAGIHPSEASVATDAALRAVAQGAAHPKTVAIGEIGLDYHYENIDKRRQQEVFLRQLQIAYDCRLPVVIHLRDAAAKDKNAAGKEDAAGKEYADDDGRTSADKNASADMAELLEKNKRLLKYGGVMHSFSGDIAALKRYLKLGLFISFNGIVTFKNADRKDIIRATPIDKIVLETDCPYLTPHPHRGELNLPAYIRYVYEFVAEAYGIERARLEEIVCKNVFSLFPRLQNQK
jgi:TatD DNase family protein